MAFFALLIKELRLLTRRERTIWLMVIYVLVLGLIGGLELEALSNISSSWSVIGDVLYITMLAIQLLLILFVTPAFTATSINGEKERQTYDMLLCSRLTPADLVGGKLLSGLTNILVLIAASLPLFSLVFFFGGISPAQVLENLITFIVTALLLATTGIFCSTLVSRPAVSTTIAYLVTLLWCGLPPLCYVISLAAGTSSGTGIRQLPYYLYWNPIIALISTFNTGGFWATARPIWQIYPLISLVVTAILYAASMQLIRPESWHRSTTLKKRQAQESPETKLPVEA